MKTRGHKTGVLTKQLINGYGSILEQGQTVYYRRYKQRDNAGIWNGKYEYHYQNLEKTILIRVSELCIKETETHLCEGINNPSSRQIAGLMFSGHRKDIWNCKIKAKHEHNGKWYCGIHIKTA